MALLPIEHQIFFFASLENFIKIVETVVKGVSIDGKFVHENFYNLLTETMKYCRHTPLKSGRSLKQNQKATPISKRTRRTRKGGGLLMRRVNVHLGEARKPIERGGVGVF